MTIDVKKMTIYNNNGGDVKKMTKDERIRFTLRMPQALYEVLASRAAAQGIAVNSLILNMLWGTVQKGKEKARVGEEVR